MNGSRGKSCEKARKTFYHKKKILLNMTINKNFELSTKTSENFQVRIRNENFHIL